MMKLDQLIKEARKGSPAAQKCLYDNFLASMKLVCRRYVKQEHDAEEVMLAGFYKFFTSLSSFHYKNDEALFGWLKRIMINECLMFLRRQSSFVLAGDTITEEPVLEENALDQLAAEEIFKLITELPVGYRTVFNLHVIEGWEHKEIAAMLNISEGTSKSQLSKAKKLLQKLITQRNAVYEQRKAK